MVKKRMTLQQTLVTASSGTWKYKIIQLSNSIKPEIGSILTAVEAKDYCNSPVWTVTIKGE